MYCFLEQSRRKPAAQSITRGISIIRAAGSISSCTHRFNYTLPEDGQKESKKKKRGGGKRRREWRKHVNSFRERGLDVLWWWRLVYRSVCGHGVKLRSHFVGNWTRKSMFTVRFQIELFRWNWVGFFFSLKSKACVCFNAFLMRINIAVA